ncbi:MAG: hypothetical protein LBS35_08695, partial [Synergistaceae bacterium]|nr:hypothetical protein [Synergistaceae bacterium]
MTQKRLDKGTRWFSPRITSLLENISAARTAIIEAPSGFGKTTAGEYLWSEILSGLPDLAKSVRKVWHTCIDEAGPLLWRHFCDTVSKIDAPTGGRLAVLGLPDDDTFGDAAFTLEDIQCERETWFFLDDFHNIERAAGARVFSEFFRHRTETLRVVILTRQFGDKALRGHAGVVWIDFRDLALSAVETKSFFASRGVRVTKKQAESAREITGGCVQGLCLELDRYRQTGKFSPLEDEGAWREIMRATIWKGLTEFQRDFLLRVSPFERYTLKQAAFLL